MADTALKYYGTGHRKNAIAKVWLIPGTGQMLVNNKPLDTYLGRKALEMIVQQPLAAVDMVGKLDVRIRALGGGIAGQAGAIRHGIAKALLDMDETLKPVLRRGGYLTRDPRVKERKKYGRKRARRGFQFSKR